MKILLAQMSHETNTFSNLPTDKACFAENILIFGEKAVETLQKTSTSVGGAIRRAKRLGLEIMPSLFAQASPGGIVTRETYNEFKTQILESLDKSRQIDGVLLCLHGAMVVEGIDNAEGDLLKDIRKLIGPSIPVAVTLDFHANITSEIVKFTTLLEGYKTYPHVDMAERGENMMERLSQVISRKLKPTTAFRSLPLLVPACSQCTLREPMSGIMKMAADFERDPRVISISVFGGFPYADIPSAGFSVYVATDNDSVLANRIADEISNAIWTKRKEFMSHGFEVPEAVQRALSAKGQPILLADMADNVGCGAPGDGTEILRELMKVGVTSAVVCNIWDPIAVNECLKVGVGKTVTLTLGGKTDEKHGAPIKVTGTVRKISDGDFIYTSPMGRGVTGHLGPSVVLDANGIMVILVSIRLQARDPEMIRFIGLNLSDYKILVIKSTVHYRAAFTPDLVKDIIEVEGPGISSGHLQRFEYKRVRRPIFPLDPQMSWTPTSLK